MQIDGRPAWEVLREFYPRLTDEDVARMVEAAKASPLMQVRVEGEGEGEGENEGENEGEG